MFEVKIVDGEPKQTFDSKAPVHYLTLGPERLQSWPALLIS